MKLILKKKPSKSSTGKPRRGSFFSRRVSRSKATESPSAFSLPPLLEESSCVSLSDESDRSDEFRVNTAAPRTAAAADLAPKHVVSTKKQQSSPAVVRDTPPFHTMALVTLLIGFFVQRLPSLESLDEIATIETFTHVNFDSLPLGVVIAVRLILAAIMLGNAASVFLYGKWEADTDYFPGSKLHVAKRIPFRGALHPEGNLFSGLQCVSTFTLWCWIVEGTSFLLAGMIPLVHLLLPNHAPFSPWVLRTAIILWETAAPVSILVSAVVKYALWPMAMEHGENVKLLKATGALLQHNLNSIAALVEVGLLGGLPVNLGHFAFPPLYGILYLLFSYAMMYSWVDDRSKGSQFFYPFFDSTLGVMTSLALVALLAILSLSFGIFCAAGHVLTHTEDFVGLVPVAAIVLVSLSVCRVRD